MEIEFQGKYQKEIYTKAVVLISKPSKRSTLFRIIAFVVFAGLYIAYIVAVTDKGTASSFEISRLVRHFITLGLFGYFIFQPFIAAHLRANRLWNDPFTKAMVYGSLSNQGVSIGKTGTLVLEWGKFAKLEIHEIFVVLMTVDKNMLVLPQDFFENESVWHRAVQLIKGKVVEPK